MPRCLVALGSNLGDRERLLRAAIDLLAGAAGISNLRRSTWHETVPIGGPGGQGAFLNAAVAFDTSLSAVQLHALLSDIETQLGRTRHERWGARAIDLDLLLFGDETIETAQLVVPHPRMAFRRFVLASAAEVAPAMVHPEIGWTIADLLTHLDRAVPYLALLGVPGSGKSAVATAVASEFGGRFLVDPAGRLAAITAGDPPSHAETRPIEFLDLRAGLLERERWQQDNVLAVSDFYFDQSLAYAEIAGPGGFEAVRQTWERWHDRVVAPKLLVVLDERGAAAATDSLRDRLLALAARRGLGPVLYAGTESRQQLDEISAAIRAMQ